MNIKWPIHAIATWVTASQARNVWMKTRCLRQTTHQSIIGTSGTGPTYAYKTLHERKDGKRVAWRDGTHGQPEVDQQRALDLKKAFHSSFSGINVAWDKTLTACGKIFNKNTSGISAALANLRVNGSHYYRTLNDSVDQPCVCYCGICVKRSNPKHPPTRTWRLERRDAARSKRQNPSKNQNHRNSEINTTQIDKAAKKCCLARV